MDSVTAPTGPRAGAEVDELAELISRSARQLRRGAAARLSPLGLTYGQARLLRLVAEAAQPLRMADIAARLEVVPRAATSMVDGVERSGLVARRPDPGDRRSLLVELTPAGQRLLEEIADARAESARHVLGGLDDAQRAQLLEIFRALGTAGTNSEQGGD